MARLVAQLRDARPEDAATLLELWSAVRHGESTPRALADAEAALARIAADPDERLLLAESDGRVVAAMRLSRGPMFPLAFEPVVHTSFLLVLPEFRKHGFGHALMEAAVSWAEEKDVHEITAVTDGNRDTNRFFARLGLATFGTVRHSSVVGLRKKLSHERRGTLGRNRHLVEVLAHRRSMRRRETSS